MKLKMLIAVAISSLFAASLTFAADEPNIGAMDNNNNGSMQNQIAPSNQNDLSVLNNPTTPDTSSMDQGVSDTATGDDDY